MDVIGFIDHTIFRWIYFFDPSVHLLELSVSTTTPAMTRTLNEVKPAMVNERDKSTKAPNMPPGSTTQAIAEASRHWCLDGLAGP